MKTIKIDPLQATIIYHALGYVAKSHDLVLSDDLKDVYKVVGEDNIGDTDIVDVLELMEMLVPIIKNEYEYHFDD